LFRLTHDDSPDCVGCDDQKPLPPIRGEAVLISAIPTMAAINIIVMVVAIVSFPVCVGVCLSLDYIKDTLPYYLVK